MLAHIGIPAAVAVVLIAMIRLIERVIDKPDTWRPATNGTDQVTGGRYLVCEYFLLVSKTSATAAGTGYLLAFGPASGSTTSATGSLAARRAGRRWPPLVPPHLRLPGGVAGFTSVVSAR